MLLLICPGPNDWDELLHLSGVPFRHLWPEHLLASDIEEAEAIAILAPQIGEPLLLNPQERMIVETAIRSGKRVFCEYCLSVGDVYSDSPVSSRRHRLLAMPEAAGIAGLKPGDILDDWDGTWLPPWFAFGTPLLVYAAVGGHAHTSCAPEPESIPVRQWALWFDQPRNLLVATFRLSSAHTARYGPGASWQALTQWLISWLLGQPIELHWPPAPVWHTSPSYGDDAGRRTSAGQAVDRAIEWYYRSGMLLENGCRGVLEGFGTEVGSDGRQPVRRCIRADCVGETALAFLAHYRLRSEKSSLQVARNLARFRAEYLQVHEAGPLQGMGRWSNAGWGVCYQDDVARAIIPSMLLAAAEGTTELMESSTAALDFLVRTTGTDGTRVPRTDAWQLTETEIRRLRETPAVFPSAHYNGHYWAALLLAYQLTGRHDFLGVAQRGLSYIMSSYPDTIREMSETEENCRLVLPLAWLALSTGAEEARKWLEAVRQFLEKVRHPMGAFLEWDTGYKARRYQAAGALFGVEEFSLLGRNGDPVVDLLYSNNWLATGLGYAWLATADPAFLKLWQGLVDFLCAAQIRSHQPWLDGAWARAFDPERHEVFGSSADVGWGPWAIETGWTVANIAAGLAMYAGSEILWPDTLKPPKR